MATLSHTTPTATPIAAATDPEDRYALRRDLRNQMTICREGTLSLLQDVEEALFHHQIHPGYSPIGWHVGHIAYTELLWILCEAGDAAAPPPAEMRRLYAADGLPKHERCNVPPRDALLAFLEEVREKTLTHLETAPIERQVRLWRFILQHESQHGETIAVLKTLFAHTGETANLAPPDPNFPLSPEDPKGNKTVTIPAGRGRQGNHDDNALDNEGPAHTPAIASFCIDALPVTQGQYAAFMDAGGYTTRRWWSDEGWAFQQREGIHRPLYWGGPANLPVIGVSAFEAEAYCRFVGKRLPSEAEWERAARFDPESGECRTYPWGEAAPTAAHGNHDRAAKGPSPVGAYPAGQSAGGCFDMMGNCWEWTATVFAPYEGFKSFPYTGYSAVYFDGTHRVLKGGSWVTRPWALRPSFRNWYQPHTREIFAGFRCAADCS